MTENTTPHVDQRWREDFTLAMRLRDASGEQIGDALATVDTHCAESGETAHEAFGTATDYATSLATRPASKLGASFAVGLLMGLLGMLAVPRAVEAAVAGTSFAVTMGDIVGIALILGLAGVLMALPQRVVPWLARARYSVVALVVAALMAVLVLAMLFLRDIVAELDWRVAFVIGIGLLMASVTSTWRDLSTPDPVADPRTADAPRRRTQWMTALMFPILTVLILAIDALFRLGAG